MYSPADWSSIWCLSLSFSLCPLSSLQSSIFIHPTCQLLGTSYTFRYHTPGVPWSDPSKHNHFLLLSIFAWETSTGFNNMYWISIKRNIMKRNGFCLALRIEGFVCFMCHLSAYANLLTLHWLLHNIDNLIEMMARVRAFFVHLQHGHY